MAKSGVDLGGLFNVALQALTANRQAINDLDGYNGNHGDNMVQNLNLIVDALGARGSKPPAEALRYAGRVLDKKGRGGTSKYYVKGLQEAAGQFKGKKNLESGDVVSLVQTLLGAIPSEAAPAKAQAGGSVLQQVLGMAAGRQQQPAQQADDGLDLGDVLETLVPAGLAFLQARQSGQDTGAAVTQALSGVLLGGRVNPLQAGTPRAAAGELVAQSILKALTGRK
jgi:hypothetical protein